METDLGVQPPPTEIVQGDSVDCEILEQKPSRGGEAWVIDFSLPNRRRKMTRRECDAIISSRIRQQMTKSQQNQNMSFLEVVKEDGKSSVRVGGAVDSEDNRHLQVVSVDAMVDLSSIIPTNLTTTREDLEQRFCLRIPRIMAVTKQYPKSCGISSLTSVWNYLYTRIGESVVGAARSPVSQEEIMSIFGFMPPFDQISWGPFTGNITLFRWFHAINRHFGVKGRAYMLYKPQGRDRTSCSAAEALQELKRVLRDPHAAVIYHCYNHYMVPVGYQDIPLAQVDFYSKNVPETNTETTIFIGEVSRGRHDAMYARKWDEIVKDLMCCSPQFYNIRRPEMGIQTRVSKKKKQKANDGGKKSEEEEDEKNGENEEKAREQKEKTLTVSESAPLVNSSSESPALVNKQGKRNCGGNLHCLMCFRSDQEEEHMERYENFSGAGSSGEDEESEGDLLG